MSGQSPSGNVARVQVEGVLWDVDFSPDGTNAAVLSFVFHADEKAQTQTYSSVLMLWDLASHRLISKTSFAAQTSSIRGLGTHSPYPGMIRFASNGSIFAYDGDRTIHIFDSKSFRKTSEIDLGIPLVRRTERGPVAMQVSPDGRWIAVLSSWSLHAYGDLKMYDSHSGKQLREWKFDGSDFLQGDSLSVSPDGKMLAVTNPSAYFQPGGEYKHAGLPGLFRKRPVDLYLLDVNSTTPRLE